MVVVPVMILFACCIHRLLSEIQSRTKKRISSTQRKLSKCIFHLLLFAVITRLSAILNCRSLELNYNYILFSSLHTWIDLQFRVPYKCLCPALACLSIYLAYHNTHSIGAKPPITSPTLCVTPNLNHQHRRNSQTKL